MHSEITLMYLILIPVILNHLVNLMISVLYKINHRLARKKKNNIIEPILYLKHYNQNWWRHLDYKRKKETEKTKDTLNQNHYSTQQRMDKHGAKQRYCYPP